MIAPSTLTPELERMMRSEARMLDLDYDALGQAERHKLRVIARRRSLIMHEEGLDVDARVVLPPADDIDAALDRLAESTARLIALDAKTRRDLAARLIALDAKTRRDLAALNMNGAAS